MFRSGCDRERPVSSSGDFSTEVGVEVEVLVTSLLVVAEVEAPVEGCLGESGVEEAPSSADLAGISLKVGVRVRVRVEAEIEVEASVAECIHEGISLGRSFQLRRQAAIRSLRYEKSASFHALKSDVRWLANFGFTP